MELFYLVWAGRADDAIMARMDEIQAAYDSLENAQTQAEHMIARGLPVIRIQDADGLTLWEP